MGTKSKVGKERRDKFYHLAKSAGFRSRAAFKLVQLNERHSFLQNARVVLDLCAAPGGWMQVCLKQCPLQSVVVGVDLVPIRNIPGATSIVDDITTDSCRQKLKKNIKDFGADVVLHDGSPNLGQAWEKDAFNQNLLVLAACKLASEFLRKGGWFVTKVFRSKDYNALIWLFQHLFQKVHSSKPQASRTESAEIFVVCESFIQPASIDQRMFDPRFLFAEVSKKGEFTLSTGREQKAEGPVGINQWESTITKARAAGYEDGDLSVHRKITIASFVFTDKPMELLQQATRFESIAYTEKDRQKGLVDDESVLFYNHQATTPIIKAYFEDIKLLNKKDVVTLLRWRANMRLYYQHLTGVQLPVESKHKKLQEKSEAKEDEDSEQEIERLQKAALQVEQRKKRLLDKKAAKERLKYALKMKLVGDKIEENDTELFSLNIPYIKKHPSEDVAYSKIKSTKMLKLLNKQLKEDMENDKQLLEPEDNIERQQLDLKQAKDTDEEMDDIEANLNFQYETKKNRQSQFEERNRLMALDESKKHKRNKQILAENEPLEDKVTVNEPELPNLYNSDSDEATTDVDSVTDADFDNNNKSRIEDFDLKRASGEQNPLFLSRTQFKKLAEPSLEPQNHFTSKNKNPNLNTEHHAKEKIFVKTTQVDKPMKLVNSKAYSALAAARGSNRYINDNKLEIVPQNTLTRKLLSPQEQAMGLAIQDKKRRQELEDASYNKYSLDRDMLIDMPTWYAEDERRHNRPLELLTEKESQKFEDKSTRRETKIAKKVLEAKARKKHRVKLRLAKATAKANIIADQPELSEQQKYEQVAKVMRKASREERARKKVVIGSKRSNAKTLTPSGRPGRPKGTKGRFKMVDKRMKKDMRAQEARDRKQKKSKKHRK